MFIFLFSQIVTASFVYEFLPCSRVTELIATHTPELESSPPDEEIQFHLRSLLFFFSGCSPEDPLYAKVALELDRHIDTLHVTSKLSAVFSSADIQRNRNTSILDLYDFDSNVSILRLRIGEVFPGDDEFLQRSFQRIRHIATADTFFYEIGAMKRRVASQHRIEAEHAVAALIRFALPYYIVLFKETMLLSPTYGEHSSFGLRASTGQRFHRLKEVSLVRLILDRLKESYYRSEETVRSLLLRIAGILSFEIEYFDKDRMDKLQHQTDFLRTKRDGFPLDDLVELLGRFISMKMDGMRAVSTHSTVERSDISPEKSATRDIEYDRKVARLRDWIPIYKRGTSI